MDTDSNVKQEKDPTTTAPAEAKAPEKKLSKAEQRIAQKQIEYNQRANRESDRIKRILCNKFREFFVLADNPEGDEVRDKIRQLNAQWMVHCKSWNLREAHFHDIKKYCEHLMHTYKKDKYDGEIPPEENKESQV